MASVVDICNLALAHLGDEATVSAIRPPDGSVQAMHCGRFYPIARDALLEMRDWRFARKRVALAAVTVDDDWNFEYAYAWPNSCIAVRKILNVDDPVKAQGKDYEAGAGSDDAQLIFTDVENAVAMYTARVTDPAKFSPLFVDALAWLLASYLAGPLLKNDSGTAKAKECFANFRLAMSAAAPSDASQRQGKAEHSPSWISGR